MKASLGRHEMDRTQDVTNTIQAMADVQFGAFDELPTRARPLFQLQDTRSLNTLRALAPVCLEIQDVTACADIVRQALPQTVK